MRPSVPVIDVIDGDVLLLGAGLHQLPVPRIVRCLLELEESQLPDKLREFGWQSTTEITSRRLVLQVAGDFGPFARVVDVQSLPWQSSHRKEDGQVADRNQVIAS